MVTEAELPFPGTRVNLAPAQQHSPHQDSAFGPGGGCREEEAGGGGYQRSQTFASHHLVQGLPGVEGMVGGAGLMSEG